MYLKISGIPRKSDENEISCTHRAKKLVNSSNNLLEENRRTYGEKNAVAPMYTIYLCFLFLYGNATT